MFIIFNFININPVKTDKVDNKKKNGSDKNIQKYF